MVHRDTPGRRATYTPRCRLLFESVCRAVGSFRQARQLGQEPVVQDRRPVHPKTGDLPRRCSKWSVNVASADSCRALPPLRGRYPMRSQDYDKWHKRSNSFETAGGRRIESSPISRDLLNTNCPTEMEYLQDDDTSPSTRAWLEQASNQ